MYSPPAPARAPEARATKTIDGRVKCILFKVFNKVLWVAVLTFSTKRRGFDRILAWMTVRSNETSDERENGYR